MVYLSQSAMGQPRFNSEVLISISAVYAPDACQISRGNVEDE
jgi:hypothetical protein